MKIIEAKIFNKEIDHSFDNHISVSSDGLYAIRITALAKAWWQHITTSRSFLKKDSLTVQLDDEGSVLIDVKDENGMKMGSCEWDENGVNENG